MSRQTLNIGLISPHQQHKSEKPGKPSLKPATASYRQSAKRFYTAWVMKISLFNVFMHPELMRVRLVNPAT